MFLKVRENEVLTYCNKFQHNYQVNGEEKHKQKKKLYVACDEWGGNVNDSMNSIH